ncbi:glycine cleavage T C-terminal barrel domain-containing protein [Spongiactinospora sp. TRM90649]|uniref:CAF17-like 4Fe-4S cluster assembly/insertion protein YgfZ n=1 Tax=Spongiactinospora sp. TRM90649 TaxID=3031114 RepID=UPI0023F859EC|nr:glycine cleavage T C-terminal barrel domain-containing protein [Spongiactinospora sp. TRM90649]MDF5751733.1 glycine cleavage T C-terminal barrel domain-containing protein [Spongiactinospora sp. TRM90649]
MTSPLLQTPGAVPAEAPDEGVAAHYGEPFAEQRALLAGEAVVDRGDREVVRITGPDRLRWLNDLSSQKLDTLSPGEPTETLFLDAQGRVEHHLTLVDDGESVWGHVEPGTGAALIGWLDRMRFMLRVEVADETARYAVVSHRLAERPPLPEGSIAIGGDVLLPREALPERLGLRPAGLWAYEALRIEEHRPRLGFETDHKTIPHEVGWIGAAVHLTKGCYRGQETVARVHNLGHPPRRLVFLNLDGSVDKLPPHGAPVSEEPGGEPVGFVGSSARHHELGPIALAVVKRAVPVEATLFADGVAAAQEVVVPPDAGRNVAIDPSLRRRIR